MISLGVKLSKFIKHTFNSYYADSLYRNSFWMMLGSFFMAFMGVFYWGFAAKHYDAKDVGILATIISISSLVLNLSTLGTNNALIKYLPNSNNKSEKVSTIFTFVFIVSSLIGVIYLAGFPIWGQKLVYLTEDKRTLLVLISFFPINTLNGITDSVFIALKDTKFVFISNLIQSISKFLIMVGLVGHGFYGLLWSVVISTLVSAGFSIIALIRLFKFKIQIKISHDVMRSIFSYSSKNFIAYIIGILPGLLMPMLVLNLLSAQSAAYYYMPSMLLSLLILVPSTIARSMFSEASSSNDVSVKKPLKTTYLILVPMISFLILFLKPILGYFGKGYIDEGYNYFVGSCISVLILSLNYFLGVALLVKERITALIVTNVLVAITQLSLSWIFVKFGLSGLGLASIVAQVVGTLSLLIFIILTLNKKILIFLLILIHLKK
jgi:O-antigen/teichoic acid export membrane protein